MPDPHDRALTQSDLACQRTRAPLGVGPRQCFQRLRHRFFHLGVGDFPRRLVDPLRDGIRDAARASCELSGNCRGDEPMEDYRKRAQRTREVVGALNGAYIASVTSADDELDLTGLSALYEQHPAGKLSLASTGRNSIAS